MKNKQTYIKGDKVWVIEPVETGTSHKRPAQIVSAELNITYPNREPPIAARPGGFSNPPVTSIRISKSPVHL